MPCRGGVRHRALTPELPGRPAPRGRDGVHGSSRQPPRHVEQPAGCGAQQRLLEELVKEQQETCSCGPCWSGSPHRRRRGYRPAVLILLDLDGTLTDPCQGISLSVVHALSGLGLPAPSASVLRSFIGPPLQDSFAALGLDDAAVALAIVLYRERFGDRGLFENQVYEGIPDALATLRASGHRLAVATSKPSPFAERIVQHFGLGPFFDLVAGATLDGVRRHKADVIAFALTELAAPAAGAVMVGDREQDISGARAHGMRSVGVRWGYAVPGELERAGADAIVDTPAQLIRELVA